MDPTALYYALSTIAQCAAALAAFIGFLGIWRLDRLRAELAQTENYLRWLLRDRRPEAMTLPIEPLIAAAQGYADEDLNAVAAANVRAMGYSERRVQQKIAEILRRRTPLASELRWLMCTLSVFLVVTMVFILVPAIVGLVHVDWLKTWAWTPWLIYVASALLAITSTSVVLTAARSSRGMLTLVLLLALASPALAGPVRCITDAEG